MREVKRDQRFIKTLFAAENNDMQIGLTRRKE